MTKAPGDDFPTRCQSTAHPVGEVPPAALGTYDLAWVAIDHRGNPGSTRTAVVRLCPTCKTTREVVGIRVMPHRFA